MFQYSPYYETQQLAAASNPLIDATYPVPQILSGTVDIRKLSCEQRQGLLHGPQLQIMIGTKRIGYIQMRALMALSPKLNVFLRQNPLITELRFGADDIDEHATKNLLRFFSCRFLGAKKLGTIMIGKTFTEAVQIYRAAVCFDLQAHVGHIKKVLHNTISQDDELLAYEELDVLLKSVSSDDRLFIRNAQKYAHLRYENKILDPEVFAKFVDAHPSFAKAMADIDAGHAREREAREFRARQREQYVAWKEREKKREELQQRKLAAKEAAAAAPKGEDKKAGKAEKAVQEPRPRVGLTRDLKPEDHARLKRLFHSD